MTREQIFGRLIAIATVLGDRVFPKGTPPISSQFLEKLGRTPLTAFGQAHTKLMQYSHKFGPEELALLDMFGELIAELDPDDESLNKPLKADYLLSYYKGNADLIIGLSESAEILGWSKQQISEYVKRGKFPEPIRRLASGPIWLKQQIIDYRDSRK